MKVYCEHSAISSELRAHQWAGRIELIYFPYDPDSSSRLITPSATLSQAQWQDLNRPWEQLHTPWNEIRSSEHFDKILSIVGPENRRDALHVDSAYKTRCKCFITRDSDILSKRQRLKSLLGIQFFHPDEDKEELELFINSEASDLQFTLFG